MPGHFNRGSAGQQFPQESRGSELALGVEEQRVNVVMDFVDSPIQLGDGYRVDVRIIVWQGESVLKVPVSALFRCGQEWSVFEVENGRARVRRVEIGHRNALEVEVTQGLSDGTEVILHPESKVSEGTRVESTESRTGVRR